MKRVSSFYILGLLSFYNFLNDSCEKHVYIFFFCSCSWGEVVKLPLIEPVPCSSSYNICFLQLLPGKVLQINNKGTTLMETKQVTSVDNEKKLALKLT